MKMLPKSRLGDSRILSPPPPRSFSTVVLPSVVNPKGRVERLHAITETWGSPSRAIYVVHEIDTYRKAMDGHSDALLYPKPLLVPKSIKEEDGVARLKYAIEKVLRLENPDFAFFVNDHTFVIPEHLCSYLSSRDPSTDLYAGHALRNKKEDLEFNSGAAGYVLSRSTMTKLVSKWKRKDSSCMAKPGEKWLQSNPGLVTAKCLQKSIHSPPIDTRDEHGAHLFHAFGLVRVVTGKVDDWYINKHEQLSFGGEVKEDVTTLLPSGVSCCSSETISFHYVEHEENLALYKIRKGLAAASKGGNSVSDKDLGTIVREQWPTKKNLGYYAAELPKESEKKEWGEFLTVLRNISTMQPEHNRASSACWNIA